MKPQALLISALDRGARYASHHSSFNPMESVPGQPLYRRLGWTHSRSRNYGEKAFLSYWQYNTIPSVVH